jgi:hypothetical protein
MQIETCESVRTVELYFLDRGIGRTVAGFVLADWRFVLRHQGPDAERLRKPDR